MTVLSTLDFLADVPFVDYWDGEFLLKDAATGSLLDTQFVVDSLADIPFVDYWDAQFSSIDSDVDTSLNNWETDVSLDGWDGDVSFEG